LFRKGGAGEATATELFNHSQPLTCGCSMLPGDCFDFHALSVSDLLPLR
jgi:hypothetical protein